MHIQDKRNSITVRKIEGTSGRPGSTLRRWLNFSGGTAILALWAVQSWTHPSSFASVSVNEPARAAQPQQADIIDDIIDVIDDLINGGRGGSDTGNGGRP